MTAWWLPLLWRTCSVVSIDGMSVSFMGSRRRGTAFGDGLQVGQAALEVAADHLVHAHEHPHELEHEVPLAGHAPGDVGPVTGRREVELGGVGGLERLDELEP